MKGKWKAVDLDPSLFSEEGMEGLVCFEELSNYRLVDSEKAAAKAAKELKKETKKKAKKRKASEEEGAGGGDPDVESNEGEETVKPAKKKAKNKKKNKKQSAKESVQQDNISTEVTNEDLLAANEDGREDETAKEDISKDSAIDSEHNVQSESAMKSNKKKKKERKQQLEKNTEEQTNLEPSSVLQAQEKEKSSQNKTPAPPKKQAKNWTNAALSGSNEKNTDVGAWKDLFVPSPVLKALSCLGFGSPTPIQALALPPAIRDRMDILGAAETGKIKMSVMLYVKAFVP